jgi:hypothetical protein
MAEATDIDRGWGSGRLHRTPRYRALGFDFGVAAEDAGLVAYLTTIFGQFEQAGEPASWYTIDAVERDGEQVMRLRSADGFELEHTVAWRIFAALVWHVNRRVIADSQDRLLIHASAAADGDTALLFPAAMEAGKTTLVAGLVRAGLSYVTDEAVAIDLGSGLVEPFPRSLSVDPGSWEVLADLEPELPAGIGPYVRAQWQVPPRSIRADAVADTCRPRFVITPQYRAGSTTRLEPLGRADAVRTMAEHSFNFRRHGGPALHVLADVARRSTCHRLVVGDLDEACELIFGLLEREVA